MKANQLGTLELRGDRLILIKAIHGSKVEVDATPLWHFFKEVYEFQWEPQADGDKLCTCGDPESQHVDATEECFTVDCGCREFEGRSLDV